MSRLVNTRYTKYEQSEREELESQVLNTLQKENIQNLICAEAEARLALVLDPEHPLPYIQQEAAIVGRLGILEYILESSKAAEEALQLAAKENLEV